MRPNGTANIGEKIFVQTLGRKKIEKKASLPGKGNQNQQFSHDIWVILS
jgi:hypothetical protein